MALMTRVDCPSFIDVAARPTTSRSYQPAIGIGTTWGVAAVTPAFDVGIHCLDAQCGRTRCE
eukprot:6483821-Amphidinium_carterae.1